MMMLEPDMITLECSEGDRVRMPCGHVIGPKSLLNYCENLLKRGEYTFTCPHVNESCGLSDCSQVWDYGTVQQVARLDIAKQQHFQLQMSENYLNRTSGMQRCGSCRSWCCRTDLTSNCVRCPLCTVTNGQPYEFCWVCLLEWLGNGDDCGNSECPAIRHRTLEHLASCPLKMIDGIQCPAVRACPNCATLLEHSDLCKHVQCRACSYHFCFICLKEVNPDDAGRLLPGKCGAPHGCKNIASRQTELAASTRKNK